MPQEQFQERYRYNPATDTLGEGGFGKVFKAYDTHRDRWVAIKIAEVKAGLEQVRLKKEVELVNKLPSHPNIAYYEECYTFSSSAGEYDFGVLQFYEAGNLQQLAERTQLSQQLKESILTQLLKGIAFLHENGIIHRDLKPQNILIVNRNGEYIPKITDFGISKQLDINKSSVFNNSLAGAGTLSFASPEQLGDKTIRKNTDLWSFGVIAFWLLSGKLPFNTGSHASTSEAGRSELFRQINSGALPASTSSLDTNWQKLIKACLIIDAEARIHKVEDCFAILSDAIHSSKPQSTPIFTPETELGKQKSPVKKPPTPPPPSLTTEINFKLLNQKINESKTDFSKEFSLLKNKYEIFELQVDLLNKAAKSIPMHIWVVFTISAMAISFFVIEDPNLRYPVMMGAGIIVGILSFNSKGNTQMKDKIDRLNVQLQREYKCPKCGMSLMGKSYNYWAGLGACPQCNAMWMD